MDRLLLASSVIMIVGGWQWMHIFVGDGAPMVHIYHAKTLLATYPLKASKRIDFYAEGDVGGSEIVIENGHVRIIHSTCASKACVLSGEHDHLGDMIACVPNRILVVIDGQKNLRLDAISQ